MVVLEDEVKKEEDSRSKLTKNSKKVLSEQW